jgi:hypothetical protein
LKPAPHRALSGFSENGGKNLLRCRRHLGLFVGMNADPQRLWVGIQGDSAVGIPTLAPMTLY